MQEQHYNHFDNERIELINPKNNEEKESKEFLLEVLQNLEKDLIINNNCQKEFDLENENNSKDFEKIEIFGNPACYICASNHKKDPSLQLFYCSHCKKLICKSCLSSHYVSNFANIENSYIKYKSPGNEELLNKSISFNNWKMSAYYVLYIIIKYQFFIFDCNFCNEAYYKLFRNNTNELH